MKSTCIYFSCLFALVAPVAAEKSGNPTIGREMEAASGAFKALAKETDAEKGAQQARKAQEAILKAMPELPKMVADMADGAEKDKAALQYRKMMGQAYVAFCELEEAFLNGKIADVPAMVASLKTLKKAGHQQFIDKH